MDSIKLVIGQRFQILEDEFEITFASPDQIRYATVAGGKSHQMTIVNFMAHLKDGTISCLFTPGSLQLNGDNASGIIRRYRYIQNALQELAQPQSEKPLQEIIARVAESLLDPKPPSTRTVKRWIHAFQLTNDETALQNKKRIGSRFFHFSIEIEQMLLRAIHEVYLQTGKKTCRDIRAFMKAELISVLSKDELKHLPSMRTLQRRVKKLDPYIVNVARHGKRVADLMAKAAGQSIITYAPLQLVEIDTHDLDIILIDPETFETIGRPYLALAIEVYTRVIIGMFISFYPASAITTLAVIKDMVTRPKHGLPGGIPAQIVPDNGVEFKNSSFIRTCGQLAITVSPSQIRTPDNKPHVERMFRTIAEGLIHKCSGTTFSNPKERGDYNSSKKAALTLDQCRSNINEWIDTVYQRTKHSSTGRVPIFHWEEVTKKIPPLSMAPEDIDQIARTPFLKSINAGRVRVNSLQYYSHALATLEQQYQGKVTVLVDELDLNSVYVQHPLIKGITILAESTNPDYTRNLTIYAHQEAQKIKKELGIADLRKLGDNDDLVALGLLMKKIQTQIETNLTAKKRRWRINNGDHSLTTPESPNKLGKVTSLAHLPKASIDSSTTKLPASFTSMDME